MSLFKTAIESQADSICSMIDSLSLDDKVAMLNMVRSKLHEVSPFKDEPVDFVEWVPSETVHANDYNPNSVAPPEMRSLELSILSDGYTQPIVGFELGQAIQILQSKGLSLEEISIKLKEPIEKIVLFSGLPEDRETVDGFHRGKIGKNSKKVKGRVHGYLPIVSIKSGKADIKNRMASTIRHNRARGTHGVMPMAEIVSVLIRNGWHDDAIAKELGMDADEVLRFKQNLGLPELFKNHSFSSSWE
jgi:hypothetical protein